MFLQHGIHHHYHHFLPWNGNKVVLGQELGAIQFHHHGHVPYSEGYSIADAFKTVENLDHADTISCIAQEIQKLRNDLEKLLGIQFIAADRRLAELAQWTWPGKESLHELIVCIKLQCRWCQVCGRSGSGSTQPSSGSDSD